MSGKIRTSRAGLTLLEVAIGMTLVAVVAVTAAMAMDTTSRALRTGSAVTELETSTRWAIAKIGERVEVAQFDMVDPVLGAPFHSPWIEFQSVLSYAAGAPVLGPPERIEFQYSPADPDDGVDNDGNGLVDEGRVVWIENVGLPGETSRVLFSGVAETMENEIPNNFADDNGNDLEDELGLAFDFQGSRLNIRLTLQRSDADGALITKSMTRSILLRN